ncbi:hypothetical protein BST27_19575 [Mycobacterium intermedium]|uniref:Transmembrane protein n=1 Tax=Mycobacterium intermedium TaxID=28445 RepID=A0A1E3S6P2_MYCIE|nr:hypothetical protein [Mycobacterium intermedium]MCV6962262.1 hypothetical protein [Mycobacterium intermedium]ODQ97770.1 hypothetical protein BHQ20_25125 [Mycobacterium intermedium]OPE49656.1 hypothetical protein BV508_13420 [Mycobacterium intermedium]ORA99296.1 hypothetical protein BST27_19575 [Mycobacterium intermedium]
MSGPHSEAADTGDTPQISVAELLARNGAVAAPTRRRRRRRGDSDAVTVAELTGEIPIIRDDHADYREEREHPEAQKTPPAPSVPTAPPAPVPQPAAKPGNGLVAEAPADAARQVTPKETKEAAKPKAVYWSEPEPRWPKSDPVARRSQGPERSEYPRPLHHTEALETAGVQSGAEHMNPDPVGHYTDTSVDVMDSEVPEPPQVALDDADYADSDATDDASEHTLFGGQSIADEVARRRGRERQLELLEDADVEAAGPRPSGGKLATLWRVVVTVFQSLLAVLFGAGLFIAFDQLWRWSSIVALVLSVLVILGLVVGVHVVRKTEDIASTLIAVAVGALITLGPLALLHSG